MLLCGVLLLMVQLLRQVSAEELQVVDHLGLIRAQREITDRADVKISVRLIPEFVGERDIRPLISQKTGISPDIEGVSSGEGWYRFHGVSPGLWRIRLRSKGVLLDSVSIE
jgi:hypothetical protein